MNETLIVSLKRVIDASARDLFEAWLDPEALASFLKPGATISAHDVKVDARVGGGFRLVFHFGEGRMPIRGEYRTIDRYTQLAFTWLSEGTVADSLVTLDFEALAPARTRLSLRHVGFPDDHQRGEHEGGWAKILEALAALNHRP